MLSFALVLIVGLGSIGLYLMAYVYPEIHRKTDIWWSGIGLFYALILLIYRRPIGLLLGHTASVVLLVWLSYQALQQRWAMVDANPPQPEAGTLGAQARAVMDQVIAKIASVNWQGLWKRMGTQANDGTSEKSILPPTIKERLDLSGLGEKLKGMISGKDTPEANPPAERDQPIEGSEPSVESSTATATPTAAEGADQPIPASELVSSVAEKATPETDQPSPDVSAESSASQEGEDAPIVEVAPIVEDKIADQPEAKKAELAAELDQVISDLSPEGQDTSPNLPHPPDPLG